MRVATYILKMILIKSKKKSAAKSIKEWLWYIKKILVEDTIVLETRIGKKANKILLPFIKRSSSLKIS